MAVKVGISSWTERTLIDSGWYPPEAHTPAARLRYYASRFRLVEVDSPYYALPARKTAEAWAERTPPGFTMNVKAFALLTGHYVDPRRLPRDLAHELPDHLRERAKVYPHDVGADFVVETAARFRDALEPLRAAGRLGLVLFQFPVWFPFGRQRMRELAILRHRFPDLDIAVELRNRTWLEPDTRERTVALLEELGFAFTCVDEPQGFASSLPPIALATADRALVRMHGRNARTWNRRVATAAERFDYRYREDELAEWVPRVQRLADEAGEVHVVFNNCHRDYAVVNAAQMIHLLQPAEAARFPALQPDRP